MPTLADQIDRYAATLIRSGEVSCPVEAKRRAAAYFADREPDLNKVLPGGAGGPL